MDKLDLEPVEFARLYCKVIVLYCIIVNIEYKAAQKGVPIEKMASAVQTLCKLAEILGASITRPQSESPVTSWTF